ncbi:MAG: hypothetical protein KAI28_04605 [Sphingomonadales bacterium]|nr:hypothetical protein [Sphingomonadales bacterium]
METTYETNEEIIAVGEGLLDSTLPKAQWTHEAHCAACIYLMVKRPEINLRKELPAIIRAYNDATDTPNTDTGGYHETITQFYITIIREFIDDQVNGYNLHDLVWRFMDSPLAAKDYMLNFYSKELLFSIKARHEWVDGDLTS